MGDEKRIARAMLGALASVHDAIAYGGFETERALNMLDFAVDAGIKALGLDDTDSQRTRLKEEFVAILKEVNEVPGDAE